MKLAVIGAGFIGKIIVERAREMGVETHCFAWEQGAVAKESSDFFYPVSVLDKEEILRICRQIGIDGVVASASVCIISAAYVAQEMNLIGNRLEVAEEITNKYRNRELTKNVPGLAQIHYRIAHCQEDLVGMRFPIILKPTDAGGKAGLSVVHNKEDMAAAFAYATENGYHEMIAEEFLEGGREYSVETLSYRGKHYVIQVTDKVSGGPPHCVELAHHQPADLSEDVLERICQVMDGILTAIGNENGPCHTEIKVINNNIYLIEVNARLGGGHISYPLTELSTGYPYISGVIEVALDCLKPINKALFCKHYASVFFVTTQTAYLKPIFDQCQNFNWCYKKQETSKELITLIKNDGYRMNYFIYYSEEKPPIGLKNLEKENGHL